jgi:tRNA G10  N-methylase Trm11
MKNQITNLYTFSLGREWKLSLAELFSVFWESQYHGHSEEIAVFESEMTDSDIIAIFRTIGGSVRVMRMIDETDERRFPTDVIAAIESRESRIDSREEVESSNWWITNPESRKITFALGAYGLEYRLSDIGLRIKKSLTERGHGARLVNIENQNINAAAFKKERLGKSNSEYSIVSLGDNTPIYLTVTLACQDIDAYARRDTGKSRDMAVGMMPPKLVQMMINIAISHQSDQRWEKTHTSYLIPHTSIYDPFCGLGTTLIEATNMWYSRVIGSDLSPGMVRATRESLDAFVAEERLWHERIRKVGGTPNKDLTTFESEVFELDATEIMRHWEARWREKNTSSLANTIIVSEGYLGMIMQRESITMDRVKSERMKLTRMYDSFFQGLRNIKFTGNIVMTFPFWDVRGTHSFFTEIYEVLEDAGFEIVPLLPANLELITPKWSLLYHRPGQNVGREVVKIRLKK